MNLKRLIPDSRNYTKINLLFLLMIMAIESLMLGYWLLILEPRIRIEADANAQIIAASQGQLISQVLLSKDGQLQKNKVNDVIDNTLLMKDPLLQKPFFLGINLEIDPEIVSHEITGNSFPTTTESITLSRGNINCPLCFSVNVGLYSQTTNELLGLANFQVNNVLFTNFKTDVRNKLLVEALIILFIALLVWYGAIQLVKQLHLQITVRKKAVSALHRAKIKAETANETKSQFLANMSHEIRTPLNAVIGMGYLVLKGELSEKQRGYLKKMDSSAHLLLNIINDILDFSKTESGKLELESIRFSLDDILDNLNKIIGCKAQEKEIDILFSVDKSVPQHLMGDPLRLGQILLNLCNNAIKFTHQGSIVINIEQLQTLNNTLQLQFNVTDTGIGMDKSQQQKLFQSFSQVDSSTTRKYGGTGLGLAISKQLTELMQGKIWVKSQQGVGSTFSFTAQFGIAEQTEKLKKLPINLQKMRVLIIDDSAISIEIFTNMLNDFSLHVYTASTAEKGFDILKKMDQKNQPIHLILMDWRLPGINGVKAAQLIKQRTDLKVIPHIILVTAYTNDEVVESARTYLDAYLPKPLTHSLLFDSLINLYTKIDNKEAPDQPNVLNESTLDLYRPDAKILLVEDNIINQEVAVAILEDSKMTIDIANNGLEAVEKVISNQYDLVLMDIQMPKMDGLEATTIIRKQFTHEQLPIIAMTAHAMLKDKEKYLSAGMNDYLSKPLVVEDLFITLGKWLAESQQLPKPQQKVISDNQNLLHMKFTGFDIKQALPRFKGNSNSLLRILNYFVTDREASIIDIKAQIIKANWKQIAKISHGLKGTSGNLFINDIYALTIKLELACEQKDVKTSLEIFEQLMLSFEQLKQSIIKLQLFCDKNSISPVNKTKIMDKNAIQLLIKELHSLIKENNLGAKIKINQLNEQLISADYQPDLKQLNNSLKQLYYDNALINLEKITQRLEDEL